MKVKVPFGFDSVGYIEVEASDREDAFAKARDILAESDLSECVSMAEPLWDSVDWVEESAMIDYNFESYTDEQMIEELDRRGYIVQKKPQSN